MALPGSQSPRPLPDGGQIPDSDGRQSQSHTHRADEPVAPRQHRLRQLLRGGQLAVEEEVGHKGPKRREKTGTVNFGPEKARQREGVEETEPRKGAGNESLNGRKGIEESGVNPVEVK